MLANKRICWVLSALLVMSLVPTSALGEAVEEAQAAGEGQAMAEVQGSGMTVTDELAEPAEATAHIEYGVASEHGDDVAWAWHTSLQDAEDVGDPTPFEAKANDQAPVSIAMRLVGAQGTLEHRQMAEDGSWPDAWASAGDSSVQCGTDVQLRLGGEVASTHSVWYRAYVEKDGWLEWAHDGESMLGDAQGRVLGIQVVLLDAGQGAREVGLREERAAGEANAKEDNDAEVGFANVTQAAQEAGEAEPQDTPAVAAEQDADDVAVLVQDDDDVNGVNGANGAAGPAIEIAGSEPEDIQVVSAESAAAAVTVRYKVHAQGYGWMGLKKNGAVAGTNGEGRRLEAIRVSLPKGEDGGVVYRVRAESYGWMDWKKNGAVAGTTGEGKRLEALRIKLTGSVSKTHDVWYRAHIQSYGWSKWVKNGSRVGAAKAGKRLEAIQVIVVPKGGAVPQQTAEVAGTDPAVAASVSYRTFSSIFSWGGWIDNGGTAGAVGISNIVEGFCAQLSGLSNTNLHYRAYVQGDGWQNEVAGGSEVGSPAQGKRLEAIRMRLTGKARQNFDIYYRVYVQGFGWLAWAKNNAAAGSVGLAGCIEAMQVRLVAKGGAAPKGGGRSARLLQKPKLQYRGSVESHGWMAWTSAGHTCGTTGEGKRLEAIQVKASGSGLSGQVQINAHAQSYGWRGYVAQGKTAGSVGESKRLEALRMRLTGELRQHFDVWYRVRVQGIGWMGWATNGQKSGTESLALRVEAVQIAMLAKGSAAPGTTNQRFIDGKKVSKLGYQNPAGYYQVSTRNVSITKAARAPWNYVTPSRIGLWATRKDCVRAFVQRAREYVGTPYVWNYSCAPGVGVDCIGLVYQCAYACGMDLGGGTGYDDFNPWAHYITGNSGWHSHDANNFWNYGKALHVPLSSRREGDVIWWPGHVAIYLGNDQIIEAYTPATGVIYSGLYENSGTPSGCIRLFQ